MNTSLYDISLKKIDGIASTLGEHRGKVLLVVNVASKCGLTPQYEGLQQLYEKYADDDFLILGFPANDFAGQEPGTDQEIQTFCSTNYQVQFPLYSKIRVTGPEKHPLYEYLTHAIPDTEGREGMEKDLRDYEIEPTLKPEVVWNFEKFLVDKNGKVVRRFSPDTAPDSAKLIAAVEQELAKTG